MDSKVGTKYSTYLQNSRPKGSIRIICNQMFVNFETNSSIPSKGFKAFIHKMGKLK